MLSLAMNDPDNTRSKLTRGSSIARPAMGSKRLAKELTQLKEGGCPAGCALVKADDLQTW